MEHDLWTSTFFLFRMPWSQWPPWPMFSDALVFAHYVHDDTRYIIHYTIPSCRHFRLDYGKTFARATPRDTTQKLSKCQLPSYSYTKKHSACCSHCFSPEAGSYCIVWTKLFLYNHHEQAMIPDDTMNFMVTQNLHYCITDYLCHHIARSVSVKTLYRWSVVIYGWCKASSITFGRLILRSQGDVSCSASCRTDPMAPGRSPVRGWKISAPLRGHGCCWGTWGNRIRGKGWGSKTRWILLSPLTCTEYFRFPKRLWRNQRGPDYIYILYHFVIFCPIQSKLQTKQTCCLLLIDIFVENFREQQWSPPNRTGAWQFCSSCCVGLKSFLGQFSRVFSARRIC